MKKQAPAVEQIDFKKLRRDLQILMGEVDRRLTSERNAQLHAEIQKLEEDANRVEDEMSDEVPGAEAKRLVTNPEPNMMMLNPELVVRLAEQHRLAITIRPDGSIFGLPQHLDRLRALVKDELAKAAAQQAGGAA